MAVRAILSVIQANYNADAGTDIYAGMAVGRDADGYLVAADRNDATIFTSAAGLAENATHTWSVSEPLSGPCDITVTYSGAIGGSHTDYVYLRGV